MLLDRAEQLVHGHRHHADGGEPGKGERHALLAPLLLESREPGALEQAAQALGLRANTLAVMLSRWRERLSQLIREELLETLADPAQVDEEMRALRAVLRG